MYIKTYYHTIRPYGTHTKIIKPEGPRHTLVTYDDTGLVLKCETCNIGNTDKREAWAQERAKALNAASYVLLSVSN